MKHRFNSHKTNIKRPPVYMIRQPPVCMHKHSQSAWTTSRPRHVCSIFSSKVASHPAAARMTALATRRLDIAT